MVVGLFNNSIFFISESDQNPIHLNPLISEMASESEPQVVTGAEPDVRNRKRRTEKGPKKEKEGQPQEDPKVPISQLQKKENSSQRAGKETISLLDKIPR